MTSPALAGLCHLGSDDGTVAGGPNGFRVVYPEQRTSLGLSTVDRPAFRPHLLHHKSGETGAQAQKSGREKLRQSFPGIQRC